MRLELKRSELWCIMMHQNRTCLPYRELIFSCYRELIFSCYCHTRLIVKVAPARRDLLCAGCHSAYISESATQYIVESSETIGAWYNSLSPGDVFAGAIAWLIVPWSKIPVELRHVSLIEE